MFYASMIVPAIFAFCASRTNGFKWNTLCTGSCALVLIAASLAGNTWVALPVICLLLLGILGDFFMTKREGNEACFLAGIGFFFAAHLCNLWLFAPNAVMTTWVWFAFGVLLIGYGLYLSKKVFPNISSLPLKAAVGTYALVSIISISLSLVVNFPLIGRLLMIASVGLLLISDTFIAQRDFAGNTSADALIIPLYLASHILITLGVLTII